MTGDMSPDRETMGSPIPPHWLKHSPNFNNLSLTIPSFQYHVYFHIFSIKWERVVYILHGIIAGCAQNCIVMSKKCSRNICLQTALCLWCIFSEFALSKVEIKAKVVNWNNNGITENWEIKSKCWYRGLFQRPFGGHIESTLTINFISKGVSVMVVCYYMIMN